MKKLYKQIKKWYYSGNNEFYCSILGPFIMGTIHLFTLLVHFDIIVLNYCIFSYLFFIYKIWQMAIERFNLKIKAYLSSIIFLVVLIVPMMVSIVMTILYRESPFYIFFWLVYLYATYGTIKMIFAVKNIIKLRREYTERKYVLAWTGLIAALYTIMMMQFRLVMFVEGPMMSNEMFNMMLLTQAAIFLFTIFVLILFMLKYRKNRMSP